MMPKSLKTSVLIVGFALLTSSASAQDTVSAPEEAPASGPSYERGGLLDTGLVVGAKLGASFGQPFGELGSSFLPELELGYILPFMERAFEVFLAGAYAAPKAEGKLTDPRFPGQARYALTQQQAQVTLGVLYRLSLSSDLIRPYGALGPRLYAMRTRANGSSAGEAFLENEDTDTKFGVFAALGAELHLGPGAVLLEASLGWAKIDGYVLRDTQAGALAGSIGYRLFL